jgi:hypothetical protein
VTASGPVLAWVKLAEYVGELGMHLLEELRVLADGQLRQTLEQLQRGIDPRLAGARLTAGFLTGVIRPDPVTHIGVATGRGLTGAASLRFVAVLRLVLHRLTVPEYLS